MTTTTAEMQLQMAIEAAEQFMKKAPYLGYDHAKNLIEAARLVLEEKDKRLENAVGFDGSLVE